MERVTRADVAREAGLAPSTVSLILNGRGRQVKISEATIARVERIARELNYIPNAAARSLRSGNSHLIALLMAELPDDPFVPVVHTVLTTAMIEIQRRGYLLVPLFQSSDDPSDAEVIRSVMGDTQLAGVIRETTSDERFSSTLLWNMGIPVVGMSMIEADDSADGAALVRIDESAGVAAIIRRTDLPSGEAAHAVFIAGPNTNHSRQNPVLARFGDRARMISLPDWDEATAYQAAFTLLSQDPRLELVCVADDSQAPGVIAAARDLDIPVPERLSVLGFGNQEPRSGERLGLTTVEWPLREMTRLAVQEVIAAIESPSPGAVGRVRTLPTSPVWRTSVRAR
ncbi:LacI family DNA-binding transcriptional regulator [Pauljensenia hongkongensis]|uniref:LacI family transcriptional regulator n=1 Tax=Pauljensenia hongkongensis TaxID=178339 RepID=A0A1D8B219_9ACTO|nr:LacI family DNA-binding transcriptional regulator [Pauljensenia hongkongensis]AOS47185.1 LacI family transcriptional regulator [Pauljensenia hongkongensis]EFW10097.1 hypothetical protein HMPREF9005_0920 [Actinomyces sp. oral taxon 178 str. F0338]RKV66436.1 MAG: LacI family transcriptional regulator [Actinomyces sp.]